jgi:hypothetical protein
MDSPLTEFIPYTKTEVKNVKYFRVFIDEVKLFSSATIRIDLFDENSNYVETKSMVISGQEYLGWQDDSYIITTVSNFLGVSLPTSSN